MYFLNGLSSCFLIHIHLFEGLFGILQMKQKIYDEATLPILLLAPSELKPWLLFYNNEIEKVNMEYEFIDNRTLVRKVI